MKWLTRHGRGERGFTLAEMMVAVVLFGTVTAIFGPVLVSAMSSTDTLQNESRALDEVRVAISRIDRELRSAESVSAPAQGTSGSTLSFRTYAGTGGAYDVTYSVVNGELVRDVGGQQGAVAEGLVVSNEEFTYTCNPGQAASVTLKVQVRFESSHSPRLVTTTIAGRNAWTC